MQSTIRTPHKLRRDDGQRHPRPAPRRQSTRAAQVRAAIKEG